MQAPQSRINKQSHYDRIVNQGLQHSEGKKKRVMMQDAIDSLIRLSVQRAEDMMELQKAIKLDPRDTDKVSLECELKEERRLVLEDRLLEHLKMSEFAFESEISSLENLYDLVIGNDLIIEDDRSFKQARGTTSPSSLRPDVASILSELQESMEGSNQQKDFWKPQLVLRQRQIQDMLRACVSGGSDPIETLKGHVVEARAQFFSMLQSQGFGKLLEHQRKFQINIRKAHSAFDSRQGYSYYPYLDMSQVDRKLETIRTVLRKYGGGILDNNESVELGWTTPPPLPPPPFQPTPTAFVAVPTAARPLVPNQRQEESVVFQRTEQKSPQNANNSNRLSPTSKSKSGTLQRPTSASSKRPSLQTPLRPNAVTPKRPSSASAQRAQPPPPSVGKPPTTTRPRTSSGSVSSNHNRVSSSRGSLTPTTTKNSSSQSLAKTATKPFGTEREKEMRGVYELKQTPTSASANHVAGPGGGSGSGGKQMSALDRERAAKETVERVRRKTAATKIQKWYRFQLKKRLISSLYKVENVRRRALDNATFQKRKREVVAWNQELARLREQSLYSPSPALVQWQSAVKIQSLVRRFLQRIRFLSIRNACVVIQAVWRGHLVRRRRMGSGIGEISEIVKYREKKRAWNARKNRWKAARASESRLVIARVLLSKEMQRADEETEKENQRFEKHFEAWNRKMTTKLLSKPLSAEWVMQLDGASQAIYYRNVRTGESQTEHPNMKNVVLNRQRQRTRGLKTLNDRLSRLKEHKEFVQYRDEETLKKNMETMCKDLKEWRKAVS